MGKQLSTVKQIELLQLPWSVSVRFTTKDSNVYNLVGRLSFFFCPSFAFAAPSFPYISASMTNPNKHPLRHNYCFDNSWSAPSTPSLHFIRILSFYIFFFPCPARCPSIRMAWHHCNGIHLKHPLKIMRWPFSPPATGKQSISHRGPPGRTEADTTIRQILLGEDLLNNLLLSLIKLLLLKTHL